MTIGTSYLVIDAPRGMFPDWATMPTVLPSPTVLLYPEMEVDLAQIRGHF